MPLHVVCRGEECRSGTSVIFPRRQMDRWMEAMRDIVSREASSVEDPERVGDGPGGGHEPGVDREFGDGPIVVVVFVLLVELVDFRFELFELLFAFLLFEGPPVRAEGAGTRGEGDLGGGQPHVQGHLQGGHGRRLRIRQFHKLEFLEAEINVLVDEFSFSETLAEIFVLLDDFCLLLVL